LKDIFEKELFEASLEVYLFELKQDDDERLLERLEQVETQIEYSLCKAQGYDGFNAGKVERRLAPCPTIDPATQYHYDRFEALKLTRRFHSPPQADRRTRYLVGGRGTAHPRVFNHRLIDEFIVTLTTVILGRASACLSHTPCPPTL
jgi:hypothetical protein